MPGSRLVDTSLSPCRLLFGCPLYDRMAPQLCPFEIWFSSFLKILTCPFFPKIPGHRLHGTPPKRCDLLAVSEWNKHWLCDFGDVLGMFSGHFLQVLGGIFQGIWGSFGKLFRGKKRVKNLYNSIHGTCSEFYHDREIQYCNTISIYYLVSKESWALFEVLWY